MVIADRLAVSIDAGVITWIQIVVVRIVIIVGGVISMVVMVSDVCLTELVQYGS